MKIFYLIIFTTYILAVLARVFKNKYGKPNLILTIIIAIILIIVSGFRSGMGDTPFYIHLYNLIDYNCSIFEYQTEPGFALFLMILKIISDDPQMFLIVTSAIINGINILMLRKYSNETCFELSIFMYVATNYIVTMNGIRQSLVASIIFMCTPLIIKRKFKIYAIIMILLSTLHMSAFIMIPLYFICTQEAWSKKIWILIVIFFIGMIFYEPIMDIIFKLLSNTKYSTYENFNEGGANILRIAVYFVPVFLAYLKKDNIKEKWINGNIFVNMTLINFLIMAASYYNWIFSRFAFYTKLYSIVLLPYVISKCFANKSEKRLIYYCFIICYLIYFAYDCKVGGIVYKSNYNIMDFFYNNIY